MVRNGQHGASTHWHPGVSLLGHDLVATRALHLQPLPVPAILLGQRHQGLSEKDH